MHGGAGRAAEEGGRGGTGEEEQVDRTSASGHRGYRGLSLQIQAPTGPTAAARELTHKQAARGAVCVSAGVNRDEKL